MAKDNLDSWDKFSSNFIQVSDVKDENDVFVCIGVEETEDKTSKQPKIRVTLEKEEKEFVQDLNKTNVSKLKELGLKAPRNLIGKKIYYKKILARNPQTNKEVDSLRIWKLD